MKKIIFIALCLSALGLTGCSNHFISSGRAPFSAMLPGNSEVGGQLAYSMDDADKNKMTHALDKGLGKSSEWTSTRTGTQYTVVPTEKLTVNGNPYCRKYQITARKNNQVNSMSGTACVSSVDSSWQAVN